MARPLLHDERNAADTLSDFEPDAKTQSDTSVRLSTSQAAIAIRRFSVIAIEREEIVLGNRKDKLFTHTYTEYRVNLAAAIGHNVQD